MAVAPQAAGCGPHFLPHTRIPVRAAPPLPQPLPAIECSPEVHYYFHISADQMAAIVREQQESQ